MDLQVIGIGACHHEQIVNMSSVKALAGYIIAVIVGGRPEHGRTLREKASVHIPFSLIDIMYEYYEKI